VFYSNCCTDAQIKELRSFIVGEEIKVLCEMVLLSDIAPVLNSKLCCKFLLKMVVM
jgi:F0F1-type ATP synthase assembly protein I